MKASIAMLAAFFIFGNGEARAQSGQAPASAATQKPGRQAPSASQQQWLMQVAVKIARTKRYPEAAKSLRERATVHVQFVLDRQGRVVSSMILKTSDVGVLDQEALDLVARGQPFPPPPDDVADAQLTFVIPVHFVPSHQSPGNQPLQEKSR